MTGTGTQNDPYIVDDWTDFITAVGTSGVYVEFPKNLVLTSDTEIVEGKLYVDSSGEAIKNPVVANIGTYYENTFVLDLNDYVPTGLTSSINVRCADFNAYGGTIKNAANTNSSNSMFYINRSYDTDVYFRNLAFLNYRTVSSLFHPADSRAGTIYFRTCIFSGEATNNGLNEMYLFNCAGNPYYCSFTMRNIGNVGFSKYENHNGYGSFFPHYCKIKLIDKLDSGTFQLEACYSCYIVGETNAAMAFRGGEYNVIDCDTPSVTSTSTMTVSLVNSDKCSSIQSGFKSVTTEQLKNATYLRSIGFPIQT